MSAIHNILATVHAQGSVLNTEGLSNEIKAVLGVVILVMAALLAWSLNKQRLSVAITMVGGLVIVGVLIALASDIDILESIGRSIVGLFTA